MSSRKRSIGVGSFLTLVITSAIASAALAGPGPVAWQVELQHEGIPPNDPVDIVPSGDGVVLYGNVSVGGRTLARYAVNGVGERQWTRTGTSLPMRAIRVLASPQGTYVIGVAPNSASPMVAAFDHAGNERWIRREHLVRGGENINARVLADGTLAFTVIIQSGGAAWMHVGADGQLLSYWYDEFVRDLMGSAIQNDGDAVFCGVGYGGPATFFSHTDLDVGLHELRPAPSPLPGFDTRECVVDAQGRAHFVGADFAMQAPGSDLVRLDASGAIDWQTQFDSDPWVGIPDIALDVLSDGRALVGWQDYDAKHSHVRVLDENGNVDWTYVSPLTTTPADPVVRLGGDDRILVRGEEMDVDGRRTLAMEHLSLQGFLQSTTRVPLQYLNGSWSPAVWRATNTTWVAYNWNVSMPSAPRFANLLRIPDGAGAADPVASGEAAVGSRTCVGCVATDSAGNLFVASWSDLSSGSGTPSLRLHRVLSGGLANDTKLPLVPASSGLDNVTTKPPMLAADGGGGYYVIAADPDEPSVSLLFAIAADGTERWRRVPSGDVFVLAAAQGRVAVASTSYAQDGAETQLRLYGTDGELLWDVETSGCCFRGIPDKPAIRVAIDNDAVWVWGYQVVPDTYEQRVTVRRHAIADGTAVEQSFPGACIGEEPLGSPLGTGRFAVMACERVEVHGPVSGTLLWLDQTLDVVASQAQIESPVALAARGSGVAMVETVGEQLTLRYLEPVQQGAGWSIELGQSCVICSVQVSLQGDEVLAAWHGDNFPPSETTHVLRAYRSGQIHSRIELDARLNRLDSVAWVGVNRAGDVILVDNVQGSSSIDLVRVSAMQRPVATFRSGFE